MQLSRWVETRAKRSPSTASTYYRRLLEFCKHYNYDPHDLNSLSNEELTQAINEFIRDKSKTYANSLLSALKDWFKANNWPFNAYVVLPKSTSKSYPVPDKKQVARAIFYADLRTKVAICFMAFSGLRPSVLAKEDGGDGLTVDDLVMNDPGDPVEVWVRTELSKIEWRYVTFFPSSLRPLLELYISKLEEDGSSRLFPVKRDTLTKQVRNALKLAGIKTPPYSLRSYFRTRLAEAEANNTVPRIYSEFWMGHTNMAIRYSFGKGVPPHELESMRERYRLVETFLVDEALRGLF